jgi:4-amino-4-deoxychorismate lyase
MSPLFETIKVRDRQLINTGFHNQRLNEARRVLFGVNEPIMLEDWIIIPRDLCLGTYRCRVVCDPDPGEIKFTPYKPPVIRTIRLIRDDQLEYPYKVTDRQHINIHKDSSGTDEVIFVKHDEITDSSIANLVFSDGRGYYTPLNPLLRGTQRAKLLSEGRVEERLIRPEDLKGFREFCMINAMLEFENATWLPVSSIEW